MNAEELTQASAAINRMFFAVKQRVAADEEMVAYIEVLHELTFDEFTAGILRARKKKATGYVCTDGEIYQEAMIARRQAFDQRTSERTMLALPAVPQEWKRRPHATVAELVESYGKAADMARANFNQALKEWNSPQRDGGPLTGDIMERRIRYRANYRHFLMLRAAHQEMLEFGETAATSEAYARALDHRVTTQVQRTKEWERR